MRHGGNIYRAATELGLDEKVIIDFSASINPLGVPAPVRAAIKDHIDDLIHYPDPDATRLRLKIAAREDIPPERIICGNGSTELIYLLARALRPAKVLLTAPTFIEYERAALMNSGTQVTYLPLTSKSAFIVDPGAFIAALRGCDMAFLCNPNNPTGSLVAREQMVDIIRGTRDSGCILVIDEAFIDFCPGQSVIKEAAESGQVIILRSLTKFYAISGLRVGYATVPKHLYERVAAVKEPWTVNSLAQAGAIAALDDRAYEQKTFRIMAKGKAQLEEGFDRLAITWFPSAANYYLITHPEAHDVRDALARKGILVRSCANFAGLDETYLRIAVKSEAYNSRLLEELRSCVA